MAFFSDEERRQIRAESMRLLSTDALAAPPREPEPAPPAHIPEPPIPDALEVWKRQADEADARRAAAKRELRHEEERSLQRWQNDVMAPVLTRLDAIEQRLDSIEQALAELNTVADATSTFSNAVTAQLSRFAASAAKLDAALAEQRASHRRELDGLHAKLTDAAVARARELVAATSEMAQVKREIDQLSAERERKLDREIVVKANDDVVVQLNAIRESLAERR
jgi:hypothetical protein